MKRLFLGDLCNLTEEEVKKLLVCEYNVKQEEVDNYDILIAYESVGAYGCDSSSFFLLRHKETKVLYENHGSHCSCYGFEGQFTPEETSLDYLKSDNFYFCTGGYDSSGRGNIRKVKDYIANCL